MNMNDLKRQYAEKFLSLNWLRPEIALAQSVSSLLTRGQLCGKKMLEIGCGNGNFTFLTVGGLFNFDYDLYLNADINGFYEGRDIYNVFEPEKAAFIKKKPSYTFKIGLDKKEALVKQADQLSLYETTLIDDFTETCAIGDNSCDVIYSNIFHWLSSPFKALKKAAGFLVSGGKIILTFPNPNIYIYWPSCNKKNEDNKIWQMINRHRSKDIKWTMSYHGFKEGLEASNNDLRIIDFKTWLKPHQSILWDIGLRPLSVPLIKMSQKLSGTDRTEIKKDFVATILPYLNELIDDEFRSADQGCMNFIVLQKN